MGVSIPDIDDCSVAELKELVFWLLERDAKREVEMAALHEEIARLKGLKGRPKIRPSGMEPGTDAKPSGGSAHKRRRGGAKRSIIEERVITAEAPPGSRFKGYESYVVEDLVVRPVTIRYRRERWRTPSGETIVAPLPPGVRGHFGAELRRYVLALYHQGRMTVPGLLAHFDDLGVSLSKRQLVRLLIVDQESFIDEARDVLRAGLETAAWISVDDTGARHKGANAICTQIGNDHFAWFATSASKSRLNFLDLLRAGHTDYVVNDAALAYMRARKLAGPLIARLKGCETRRFADDAAWTAHLDRLGLSGLAVNPDPVRIATEGALWGSVLDHRFLADAVIVSDDAGQFNVGFHALCWVHAERLIHKLDTFTDAQRQAVEGIRTRVWKLYDDLKAYQQKPSPRRKAALQQCFDGIFTTRTGYVTLDRLLQRLHANADELLAVLDRPEIPLHTNGSENDIRCQVIRRKISAGTRSDTGRQCRDGFLSLMKTCQKLGVTFWAYLGNRLHVPETPVVMPLPKLIRTRASPA